MLYTKNNPIGIDREIDRLQKNVFKNLLKKWSIEQSNYNCFCRAYKNQQKGGYIPEFYAGNNEYRELFFDDTVFVTSFFTVADKTNIIVNGCQTVVSLIFCVDISKLKDIPHRGDEEIRQDVLGILKALDLISVETGINNVFKEFSVSNIKYRDLHPLHCFRFNFNIIYSNC
ncbi:MAG: hypothetical protein LBK94_13415 [Prevotellaceae bacterium]|jgi:hypothetical protein|nr:hypothetical protein [Prevotellaceae bacterium]